VSDIYQDVPDRDFTDTRFKLVIGEAFYICAQFQHGFMRAAVFTPTNARWASGILVDDLDNFTRLLQESAELVILYSRPARNPRSRLKLIKE
jgi:hypothetical protein